MIHGSLQGNEPMAALLCPPCAMCSSAAGGILSRQQGLMEQLHLKDFAVQGNCTRQHSFVSNHVATLIPIITVECIYKRLNSTPVCRRCLTSGGKAPACHPACHTSLPVTKPPQILALPTPPVLPDSAAWILYFQHFSAAACIKTCSSSCASGTTCCAHQELLRSVTGAADMTVQHTLRSITRFQWS